jgi:ADP-heptose:LPS heptosyltransferase
LLEELKSEQFSVAERVYSVDELMSRLSKETAFVIGADTGPVHFAAALGVPTLMLFKSTRLERYSHPDLKVLYPLLISSEFDLEQVGNAIANLVKSNSQVKN